MAVEVIALRVVLSASRKIGEGEHPLLPISVVHDVGAVGKVSCHVDVQQTAFVIDDAGITANDRIGEV
jgi:hypothetical protein